MPFISISRCARFSGSLPLVLLLSALAAKGAGEQAIPNPFSKQPYLQCPGPGVVSILWESATNSPARVHFGRGDKLDQHIGEVLPRRLESFGNTSESGPTKASPRHIFYLYEAILTNLAAGATYSYSVELGATQTTPRQWHTLNPGAERVRFIAYGDSRTNPDLHTALAKNFMEHAPDFILHSGDLAARGDDYDLWLPQFFTPLQDVLDRVLLFPVIGNHEREGTNYFNYFHSWGGKRWYSFDAGPVHVLALDFHFEKGGDEQFRFAREDLLASHAPWKIVTLHTPIFNIGGHGSAWGHAAYLPLFHEAKVDLVVAGHSHMYERFRPVAPGGKAEHWAIMHVTSGGGGAPFHLPLGHPALVAKEAVNHFMVFDVTSQLLRAKAIRLDGTVLDSFEIRKIDGRPNREYLSQVYPEESLDLCSEMAPNLVGIAATLPAADATAEVILKVRPRKESSSPAELEVSLAPESAKNYELVNGPLHATTPTPGQTNMVRAQVRARADVKVSRKPGREISPVLIFEAAVKAPEGETVAYGAASQVAAIRQGNPAEK
jgi:Calcineurin-like phosphoesterase